MTEQKITTGTRVQIVGNVNESASAERLLALGTHLHVGIVDEASAPHEERGDGWWVRTAVGRIELYDADLSVLPELPLLSEWITDDDAVVYLRCRAAEDYDEGLMPRTFDPRAPGQAQHDAHERVSFHRDAADRSIRNAIARLGPAAIEAYYAGWEARVRWTEVLLPLRDQIASRDIPSSAS